MKKQLIIGLGALLLSNALMAQHFFDICEDKLDTERYMDPPTDDYNFNINANYFNTTVQVNSYNGEYQIFANKIACEGECESLSYKIELISFPFYPDCIASDCGADESTVRQLKTFGDASYSEDEKAWVMNFADDRLAQKVFFGDFDQSSSSPSYSEMSEYQSLLSLAFTQENWDFVESRTLFPHSVFRHTIYMQNSAGNKIDSLTYVLDHTRGRMKYYPFSLDNGSLAAQPMYYDVTIIPSENPEYIDWDFSVWDYTPYKKTLVRFFDAKLQYYVGTASINGGHTLIGNHVNSSNPEICRHQYNITEPLDLRTINPSERIIYNPEEVNIVSPELVFPSGYTFKSMYSIYPSHEQVAAADPYNLVFDKEKVNIDSEKESTYRIKAGSTLIIEPCVSLYDMDIIVEEGATLKYDADYLYGYDYQIIAAGGTIENNYNPEELAACPQECYQIATYQQQSPVINTNTLWNSQTNGGENLSIAGTLTIKTGWELRIENMNLQMAANAKIVVEQGARLELLNTTINALCDDLWAGIEVWGNNNTKQFYTGINDLNLQGILSMENCSIANSRYGILAGKRSTNSSSKQPLENNGGGVLHIRNSTFTNNVVGVQFSPYRNYGPNDNLINNISLIKNTHFQTTDYLHANQLPFAHIYLQGVDGIRIGGCTLENNTVETDYNKLGVGILSENAGFKAGICWDTYYSGDNNCDDYGANTFSNLKEGIWCTSLEGGEYVRIQQNNFSNNLHAISLEGLQYAEVYQNTISMPPYQQSALDPGPYPIDYIGEVYGNLDIYPDERTIGIYLNEASYFSVEENTISSSGTSNYGILCDNSVMTSLSAVDGFASIYKNSIAGQQIGIQCQRDNRGTYGFAPFGEEYGECSGDWASGLNVQCNTFEADLDYALAVVGYAGNGMLNPGIASYLRNQGLCFNYNQPSPLLPFPAGNQFLNECIASNNPNNPPEHHIYKNVIGDGFSYAAHSNLQPECYNTSVGLEVCPYGYQNMALACPSKFTHQKLKDPGKLSVVLEEYTWDIAARLEAYHSLVDGGNTLQKVSEMEATTSEEDLRQSLLADSPYLSNKVLKTLLQRQPHLDSYKIGEVLIANSPLAPKVLQQYLNTHLNCCPPAVLNSVILAQYGVSSKKELEQQIDAWRMQKQLLQNKYIGLLLDDSDYAAAINYLEAEGMQSSLFSLYLQIADTAAAQALLPNNTAKGKWWSRILANKAPLGTPADRAFLKAWADTASQPSLQWALWNEKLNDLPRQRPIFPLQTNVPSNNTARLQLISETGQHCRIYPNPSTKKLYLEWTAPATQVLQISVLNALGQKVAEQSVLAKEGANKHTILVDKQPKGNYYLKIQSPTIEEMHPFIKTD